MKVDLIKQEGFLYIVGLMLVAVLVLDFIDYKLFNDHLLLGQIYGTTQQEMVLMADNNGGN